MILEKYQVMKNYILTIGILLFLISCGKNEKQNEVEAKPEKISYYQKDSIEKKEVETLIYHYDDYDNYIEKVDIALLSKVASNLKIPYDDVNVEESSSIDFNDSISFLVVFFKTENKEGMKNDEGEIVNVLQRKYVFVTKTDGKIIAQETDDNLSYYDDEATGFSKTYVLKNIIKINESTNGIGFVTETNGGGRISLYSQKIFTIITLVNNKIKKVLYDYPVRKTDGDSNGGGTFQMESLEKAISVSNKKTNGFFDLKVAKTFSYEEEVEEDLEKGIKGKVAPIKIKKESEKIQFNGKIYSFIKDDKYRFLLNYN